MFLTNVWHGLNKTLAKGLSHLVKRTNMLFRESKGKKLLPAIIELTIKVIFNCKNEEVWHLTSGKPN